MGVVEKAEGSAWVKLGATYVMAGVKLGLDTPYPDAPDEGILRVAAEFTPLASPEFELGRPGEDAIELARVVDRGIRESGCIELEKLCIEPAERVWGVFIDLLILNHAGNLLDASALASLAALWNTKMPRLEGEEIVRGEWERPLPVVWKPINLTVGRVRGKFLLDPCLEEELVLEAQLSVCVRDDDMVCSLQKRGSGTLRAADVEQMIRLVIDRSKELRRLVK
jgi:exosome complex component RRP42